MADRVVLPGTRPEVLAALAHALRAFAVFAFETAAFGRDDAIFFRLLTSRV